MKNWIKKPENWSLLLYLAILLLPSLWISPRGFIRALYPFLFFMALFPSPRIFFLWTLPFFILVPAALFFFGTFHAPMGVAFWLIIKGASLFEIRDYLATNAIPPIVGSLLLLGIWFFFLRHAKSRKTLVAGPSRWLCLALVAAPAVHIYKDYGPPRSILANHFRESYPWNAIASYWDAESELEFYKTISIETKGLIVRESGPRSQNVVVVLGESAGRSWLQVYGHAVPNTPHLNEAKDQAVILTDFISLEAHTVGSVPVFLARERFCSGRKLKTSFLQVFKAAGYKTFWISNQASLGGAESFIGYYARSTDHQKFFHIHSFSEPVLYDEAVLNEFLSLLQDPAPKKLFVLHLQGSHPGFKRRYPPEYEVFQNPYDNSILYTDHILSEIFSALENDSSPSYLFYSSDHGLLMDRCGMKVSHFDSKSSYEVPAFFWFSKKWLDKNQSTFSLLKSRSNLPGTSRMTMDTLLHLAKIQFNISEPTLDLLGSAPDASPRLVRRYDDQLIDYDHATDDSSCHIRPLDHQTGK